MAVSRATCCAAAAWVADLLPQPAGRGGQRSLRHNHCAACGTAARLGASAAGGDQLQAARLGEVQAAQRAHQRALAASIWACERRREHTHTRGSGQGSRQADSWQETLSDAPPGEACPASGQPNILPTQPALPHDPPGQATLPRRLLGLQQEPPT